MLREVGSIHTDWGIESDPATQLRSAQDDGKRLPGRMMGWVGVFLKRQPGGSYLALKSRILPYGATWLRLPKYIRRLRRPITPSCCTRTRQTPTPHRLAVSTQTPLHFVPRRMTGKEGRRGRMTREGGTARLPTQTQLGEHFLS